VSGRRAVFLDRDGTIIDDVGYLRDVAGVRLLPGAGEAIRRLNQQGILAIVVTNQSGIARGLLTESEYLATQQRLDELLASEGARLDAHYFCPHLPDMNGPCECRKPGTLLYRQAAERFGIDLSSGWWIGDHLRDVIPAKAFGGAGILVLTGGGKDEASTASAQGFMVTSDLSTAAPLITSDTRVNRDS
jgi:D-glycero-D-manno-heptose 1,7-bisphosphate phosphatase